MRIPFFSKARLPASSVELSNSRGWINVIREPFSGAWQRNIEIKQDTVLAYFAVFACMTLIASDISKLYFRKVKYSKKNKIWEPANDPYMDGLLRTPNGYQTRTQFVESWLHSKLATGNAYIWLQREGDRLGGKIVAMHVLDPIRVRPVVTDDGEVYYQFLRDNLTGQGVTVTAPESEIIHDRFNCIFNPLIGASPIVAAGLAAMLGTSLMTNTTQMFQASAVPGGILTAPGAISPDNAIELKQAWEQGFGGKNFGKIAVLGDGLTFTQMNAVKSTDAQVIEQLRWTAEVVASCFHVPPYKIGVGQMPAFNNIQALNTEYYSQCLQRLIEDMEACYDRAMGYDATEGVEANLDGLLRMDTLTMTTQLKESVGAAIMSPNEARNRMDLPPVEGGDAPFIQQQNYSLEDLAKLRTQEQEAAKKAASAPALPPPDPPAAPAAEPAKEPAPAKTYAAGFFHKLLNDRRGTPHV